MSGASLIIRVMRISPWGPFKGVLLAMPRSRLPIFAGCPGGRTSGAFPLDCLFLGLSAHWPGKLLGRGHVLLLPPLLPAFCPAVKEEMMSGGSGIAGTVGRAQKGVGRHRLAPFRKCMVAM